MKRTLKWLGIGLGGLLSVLLVRTAMFTAPRQPLLEPPNVVVDTASAAARLAGAIRIRTISNHDINAVDEDAFLALHRYLAASFPKAHQTLEREVINDLSLMYKWTGSEPNLPGVVMMAHLDVVPVASGTENDWIHPPFSGTIADGYIWGRGTLDVKSGVTGLLEAVELLLAEDFRPRRTIYFAFGHDEEVGGQSGAKAIAELLASRNVQLEMVLDEGGAIVSGVVPAVAEPIAMIGVAEKGYLSLQLTVDSEGGHSSMPPPQTAIGILSSAITKIESEPFEPTMAQSGRFFANVAPRMPFLRRIPFANMWLFEPLLKVILSSKPAMAASIRTTSAVTMINGGVKANVLPTQASAVVNFRIYPGETIESVKDAVVAKVDDDRVKIEILTEGESFGTNPSPVSDVESKSYALLERSVVSVSQQEGIVVTPYLVVGATDSRYFVKMSKNVYRFLFNGLSAEDLPRIHGTNERISVENYAKTVAFYHEVLRGTDTL